MTQLWMLFHRSLFILSPLSGSFVHLFKLCACIPSWFSPFVIREEQEREGDCRK